MASQCRAKNPATCRTHGVGLQTGQTAPTNDEAGKSEFFGASVWGKVTSMQERTKISGKVRGSLKNAFRDIKGFSEKNETDSKSTRKFIVSLLARPELGTVDKEGESSAAVNGVRDSLRGAYEETKDGGGASALATVRIFRELGRENELSPGLVTEAYLHAQKPAIGASFEAKAEAMVHVLNKHKVFGDTLDGRWLKSEMRGFEGMVRDQATGKDSHNALELTYRGSNVRLLVNAKVIDNEVTITRFKAYDHPSKNSRMDYEGLNNDLTAIFFDED